MKIFLILSLLVIGQCISIAQPSGIVIEWGRNSNSVVTIAGKVLTNATTVAAGETHCLALKEDGTIAGWGWNNFGQATGVSSGPSSGLVTIDGQTLSNVTAIAVGGTQSIAIKNDGTIATWGADYTGRKIDVPSDLRNVVSIAGWHSLVVKNDDTVINTLNGQAVKLNGQPVSGFSNIVAIATRDGDHAARFGHKKNGTVIVWGSESTYGDATPPAGLSNVVAIAAGQGHTLALKDDETVIGWGFNRNGEATGVPSTGSIYVASGLVTIAGLVLTNITAIAAGDGFSLALKRDGTVVAWGNNRGHRMDIPAGLSNVVAIATSGSTCLAITTNAAVAERFRQK